MTAGNESAKKRRILIVGGAGYIGSVLARTLIDSGYRVRVLDALLYDNIGALDSLQSESRFEFIHGDMTDQATTDEALRGVSDVVLLAALVGDPACKQDPERTIQINDTGTINLIEQLAGKDIKRLVFMSTCSNYGLRETDQEADEEAELNPQSLYAEIKVKVERHLLGSAERFDFAPTVLRCATAYGLSPRMRFDLTINEFTRELALGQELLVYDADTWRPYCHVLDISQAIRLVLESELSLVERKVFNVGSLGENYTKRMVVELVQEHLPLAKIRYREGQVDPRNYRVDFSRIADRLGFQATIRLTDFVAELIAAIGEGRFADYEARKEFYRNS
jgi:nucleoside-diphosphate-sugar epimerase